MCDNSKEKSINDHSHDRGGRHPNQLYQTLFIQPFSKRKAWHQGIRKNNISLARLQRLGLRQQMQQNHTNTWRQCKCRSLGWWEHIYVPPFKGKGLLSLQWASISPCEVSACNPTRLGVLLRVSGHQKLLFKHILNQRDMSLLKGSCRLWVFAKALLHICSKVGRYQYICLRPTINHMWLFSWLTIKQSGSEVGKSRKRKNWIVALCSAQIVPHNMTISVVALVLHFQQARCKLYHSLAYIRGIIGPLSGHSKAAKDKSES